MACGVSCSRGNSAQTRPLSRKALSDAAAANKRLLRPEFELTGTWDVKWPIEKTIRVAFQTPRNVSPEDFSAAKVLVAEYAERWRAARANIDWAFTLPDLPPALGDRVPKRFRHLSAVQPQDDIVPYDVLISLDPLPITLEDPFREGQTTLEVRFPVSELGSYARRTDYGAPTMYVGPFGHWSSQRLLDYLRHPIGQHVIVHEFGHALGLPHLHQHPALIKAADEPKDDVQKRTESRDAARAQFYRPPEELIDVLAMVLGVRGNVEDVQNHITRVWRGNEAYSDWRAFSVTELDQHRASAALDSAMSIPYYRLLKRGDGKQQSLEAVAKVASALKTTPKQVGSDVIVAPTALDMETLRLLYGPPASARP